MVLLLMPASVKSPDKMTEPRGSVLLYQSKFSHPSVLFFFFCLDLPPSNFPTSICSSITWQQFSLLKLSVASTHSVISLFFSHYSLNSLCGYYLPNHFQSSLNLFFWTEGSLTDRLSSLYVLLLLKRRKQLWLKVKCSGKSALRSYSVGHWEY